MIIVPNFINNSIAYTKARDGNYSSLFAYLYQSATARININNSYAIDAEENNYTAKNFVSISNTNSLINNSHSLTKLYNNNVLIEYYKNGVAASITVSGDKANLIFSKDNSSSINPLQLSMNK